MTASFQPEDLMLSRRLRSLRREPFCFFEIDDFLPAPLYRELAAGFPEDVPFARDGYGAAGFRSSVSPDAFERFCAERPAWGGLVDFLGSDAFLGDLRRTLRTPLGAARGAAALRPWLNCTRRDVPRNPLRYAFQEPVRATFQLSRLPRDAVVVPHTDAPRKLVSLVLYFPSPDWRPEYGGGTEFYAPLDPRQSRRWSPTQRVPFEELKLLASSAFAANRLVGFVRSDASYHGVQPLACPAGLERRSLLVNVKRVKWSKRAIP